MRKLVYLGLFFLLAQSSLSLQDQSENIKIIKLIEIQAPNEPDLVKDTPIDEIVNEKDTIGKEPVLADEIDTDNKIQAENEPRFDFIFADKNLDQDNKAIPNENNDDTIAKETEDINSNESDGSNSQEYGIGESQQNLAYYVDPVDGSNSNEDNSAEEDSSESSESIEGPVVDEIQVNPINCNNLEKLDKLILEQIKWDLSVDIKLNDDDDETNTNNNENNEEGGIGPRYIEPDHYLDNNNIIPDKPGKLDRNLEKELRDIQMLSQFSQQADIEYLRIRLARIEELVWWTLQLLVVLSLFLMLSHFLILLTGANKRVRFLYMKPKQKEVTNNECCEKKPLIDV